PLRQRGEKVHDVVIGDKGVGQLNECAGQPLFSSVHGHSISFHHVASQEARHGHKDRKAGSHCGTHLPSAADRSAPRRHSSSNRSSPVTTSSATSLMGLSAAKAWARRRMSASSTSESIWT